MAGLRACAPVKTKGGLLERPYNRNRNPARFRELGESDEELDMDPRGKTLDSQGVIPMPADQSISKMKPSVLKTTLPPMILPDDQIPSHTFPRPGETIGRKKGKQQIVRCKCCERELTKEDRAEKSLIAKYVKCTACKELVCVLCRDRENRCHECYVQKSVNLDPSALMEFQRETLLRFLEILHYNEGDFEDYDKAHLVKQLLTRFRVHELWDPRFHADPLEIEELKKKKEEKMLLEDSIDDGYSSKPSSSIPTGRLTKSSSDLLDEEDYLSHRPIQTYAIETKTVTPPRQRPGNARKEASPYAPAGPLLLQNISTPKQIEDLETHEIRAILNHYGQDVSGERPALKYRVLQLWNAEVLKGQQSQGERNTPSPGFNANPRSANLPKTFSLKDIPSSSAIEKLTITQMKTLLRKYNHDPEDFPHRSDMEYQVLLLWNEAKRKALGIQKEKQMPGLNPVRNWKSQENVQSPTAKWTSAAAKVQPTKDIAGPRHYGGASPYDQGNWGDVKRYIQGQEDIRREDQYNPYQDPGFKSTTLTRHAPPMSYSPEPAPASPVRHRPSPPAPPPLPPPAPHLLKNITLQDINKPEEIPSLSMRQMLELLDSHNINTDGATDKAHLENLVKQLWFDKIMPVRNPVVQQRAQDVTYHRPQNPPQSPYQMNPGVERQFGAMSVSSQQKYNDGDNYSKTTMTQKTYTRQETSNTPYMPYGPILSQDRGPTEVSTVKKTNQEMCTVCLVRPIDCIILNCGHMVSCMVCVSRMDACPLCHSEIARIINIK